MAARRRLKDLVGLMAVKPGPDDPRIQKAQKSNEFTFKFLVLFMLAVGAVTPMQGDVALYVRYIGYGCVAALAILAGMALFKQSK